MAAPRAARNWAARFWEWTGIASAMAAAVLVGIWGVSQFFFGRLDTLVLHRTEITLDGGMLTYCNDAGNLELVAAADAGTLQRPKRIQQQRLQWPGLAFRRARFSDGIVVIILRISPLIPAVFFGLVAWGCFMALGRQRVPEAR